MSINQTGAVVAKPVIEGHTNSRILILVDGLKLESQDWADSHAPEIDPSSAEKISILKGAESVRYGAGAIGGVVLVESRSIDFHKKFYGQASLSGNSNSKASTGNLNVGGTIISEKLAWQLNSSAKKSGDYKTAEYYVNNTGQQKNHVDAKVSFRTGKFSTELYGSRFQEKTGVFFGSLTGNIEQFEELLALGRPARAESSSYKIAAPYQQSLHYTIRSESSFKFSSRNSVEFLYGFQKNQRKEFDVRRADRTVIPAQNMHLNSHFGEILWRNSTLKNLRILTGASFSNKENFNEPGTGVVPSIPNYIQKNFAFHMGVQYFKNKLETEMGTRIDLRKISSLGYNFLGQLYGGKRDFQSFSWITASRYSFTKSFNIAIRGGLAWRAPEVYELYVNGKQHGLPVFFIGDPNLKAEKALKFSMEAQFKQNLWSIHSSIFYQPIRNYIYSVPMHQFRQLFSGPAALFNFKQTDVLYTGGDIALKINAIHNIEYYSNISFVFARDKNTGGKLPMVPPMNLHQSLKYNLNSLILNDLYIRLEHNFYAKQKEFNADTDLSPDSPPAFHLFNIKIGASLEYTSGKNIDFIIGAENIFNCLYKNYTDHWRYFVHGKGLDLQLKTAIHF